MKRNKIQKAALYVVTAVSALCAFTFSTLILLSVLGVI